MVIDVHYHFMVSVNETAAKRMVASFIMPTAKKLGMTPDPEALVKTVLETWADPAGEFLIKSMDEGGIDVTVAVTTDNFDNKMLTREEVEKSVKLLSEVAKRNPGRIFPLAGLDPRRPEAADMAKRFFEEYGIKGIKYHPDNGYDPSGPESYKVLEVLAEHKGVLLTHTSPLMPPSRNHLAEPMLLSAIGVDFPQIKVIAAHMNGYVNWRPWASLAAMQPRLYGDLAMWDNLAYTHYDAFCRELRTMIDLIGPNKILFGSDAPIDTLLHPIRHWVQQIRNLTEKAPAGVRFTQEEVDAILGGNAARVLGLNK
ncbi:MAG: amidohydrolase family protein [Proteobacteria bacterium]|nr:amidohydrolase family protein [Pseudomonadota bacterium]MBU4470197.1 amidohydrolase family protein [Pseudomonadota bacterium]MCG2752613.1 amidohydrolase family protein [Desulfobacteraceae bacterium]